MCIVLLPTVFHAFYMMIYELEGNAMQLSCTTFLIGSNHGAIHSVIMIQLHCATFGTCSFRWVNVPRQIPLLLLTFRSCSHCLCSRLKWQLQAKCCLLCISDVMHTMLPPLASVSAPIRARRLMNLFAGEAVSLIPVTPSAVYCIWRWHRCFLLKLLCFFVFVCSGSFLF